jgi:hypothetical protein
MAKTKISEFDPNPANNTDIDGINIAEGMAPGLVNNAFRELMAQLKDFQAGTAGDNFTVGGNLTVTGTATLAGRAIDAFPTGTRMLFQQTAAPTGWTKITTEDNKALRVVSGTAGTGGSVAFTTAFGSQNVGATTLTSAQIPGHTHGVSGNTGNNNVGHTHGFSGSTSGVGDHQHFAASSRGGAGGADPAQGLLADWPSSRNHPTSPAGAHSHTFSGTTGGISANHIHSFNVTSASTGGGGSHTHSLNLAVSYVDVIICSKN